MEEKERAINQSLIRSMLIALSLLTIIFTGCQSCGTNTRPPDPTAITPSPSSTIGSNAELAFTLLDSLALPAGWMSGGGNPQLFISLGGSQKDCLDRTGCIKIAYKVGGQWGGVFWWPQSCGDSGTDQAWQKVRSNTCGINLFKAGNFSIISRIKFWVRGERGGEAVEFKVGSVDLSPKPGRSTGRLILTKNWELKEMDLRGVDLSNASALFAWIATDAANPTGATFYLDSIQFEGIR